MGEILVTPAIDIQVVFGADGSRAFQARFAPLPLDIKRPDLDTALDLVLEALDRQRAKYELADEEQKLADQKDRLRKYEGGMISLDESSKAWWEAEGRKGEWDLTKLSPNARNERERLQMALNQDRHDATARQARIARLKEKVNGHAADSRSDRRPGV